MKYTFSWWKPQVSSTKDIVLEDGSKISPEISWFEIRQPLTRKQDWFEVRVRISQLANMKFK